MGFSLAVGAWTLLVLPSVGVWLADPADPPVGLAVPVAAVVAVGWLDQVCDRGWEVVGAGHGGGSEGDDVGDKFKPDDGYDLGAIAVEVLGHKRINAGA